MNNKRLTQTERSLLAAALNVLEPDMCSQVYTHKNIMCVRRDDQIHALRTVRKRRGTPKLVRKRLTALITKLTTKAEKRLQYLAWQARQQKPAKTGQ